MLLYELNTKPVLGKHGKRSLSGHCYPGRGFTEGVLMCHILTSIMEISLENTENSLRSSSIFRRFSHPRNTSKTHLRHMACRITESSICG